MTRSHPAGFAFTNTALTCSTPTTKRSCAGSRVSAISSPTSTRCRRNSPTAPACRSPSIAARSMRCSERNSRMRPRSAPSSRRKRFQSPHPQMRPNIFTPISAILSRNCFSEVIRAKCGATISKIWMPPRSSGCRSATTTRTAISRLIAFRFCRVTVMPSIRAHPGPPEHPHQPRTAFRPVVRAWLFPLFQQHAHR
jgi:hypothetical protein